MTRKGKGKGGSKGSGKSTRSSKASNVKAGRSMVRGDRGGSKGR